MLDHTLHAPQRPIVGFVVVHSIGTRTFWLCIKTSKMLGNVHSVAPEKISSRCQSSSKSMVGLAKAKESDPAVVLRGKRSSLLRWILPIVAWDSAATSSSKNPSTAAFLAIFAVSTPEGDSLPNVLDPSWSYQSWKSPVQKLCWCAEHLFRGSTTITSRFHQSFYGIGYFFFLSQRQPIS